MFLLMSFPSDFPMDFSKVQPLKTPQGAMRRRPLPMDRAGLRAGPFLAELQVEEPG